jgi:hypothetical protein
LVDDVADLDTAVSSVVEGAAALDCFTATPAAGTLRDWVLNGFDAESVDAATVLDAEAAEERPVEWRPAAEPDADECVVAELDESAPAVSATATPAVLVATAVPIPNATASAPTRPM